MPGRMCYVSEKEEGVGVMPGRMCCVVSEQEEGVVVLYLEGCVRCW